MTKYKYGSLTKFSRHTLLDRQIIRLGGWGDAHPDDIRRFHAGDIRETRESSSKQHGGVRIGLFHDYDSTQVHLDGEIPDIEAPEVPDPGGGGK